MSSFAASVTAFVQVSLGAVTRMQGPTLLVPGETTLAATYMIGSLGLNGIVASIAARPVPPVVTWTTTGVSSTSIVEISPVR